MILVGHGAAGGFQVRARTEEAAEVTPELRAQLRRVARHLRRAGTLLERAQVLTTIHLGIGISMGEVVIINAKTGEVIHRGGQRGNWEG